MRLQFFELNGKQYYEANVWEENEGWLLCDCYSTKNEAIKAVKTYKKNYKGNKKLDCFVRLHDKNGIGIVDYNI